MEVSLIPLCAPSSSPEPSVTGCSKSSSSLSSHGCRRLRRQQSLLGPCVYSVYFLLPSNFQFVIGNISSLLICAASHCVGSLLVVCFVQLAISRSLLWVARLHRVPRDSSRHPVLGIS